MNKRWMAVLISAMLALQTFAPALAENYEEALFDEEAYEDSVSQEMEEPVSWEADEGISGETINEEYTIAESEEETLLTEDGSLEESIAEENPEDVLPSEEDELVDEALLLDEDEVLTEALSEEEFPAVEAFSGEETSASEALYEEEIPDAEEFSGEDTLDSASEGDVASVLDTVQNISSALEAYTAGYQAIEEELPMAGYSQTTRNVCSEQLKNYIRANGEVDEEGTYFLTWQDTVDGNETVWEICYATARNEFLFYQTAYVQSESETRIVVAYMVLPYGRKGTVSAGYRINAYDSDATYINLTFDFSRPAAYKGTEDLPVTFNMVVPGESSQVAAIKSGSNSFLRSAFKKWNDLLLIYPHVAMTTLGFDAYRFTHTHVYEPTLITPAGINTDGKYRIHCITCNNVKSTKTIKKISTITLDRDRFTYNGKVQKPNVVILDSAGKEISEEYYEVAYSDVNSKKVGTYTVTVTFSYYYTGSQTLTYNIVKAAPSTGIPARPKLIASYNSIKGIGIHFYPVKNAQYYVIYRKYKGVWKAIKTVTTNSPRVEVLKDRLIYMDTTVKNKYGEGYIYSVAAKNKYGTSAYDKKGSAIYRLTPPPKPKVIKAGAGSAYISWGAVSCLGYEVQYRKAGTSVWKKCPKTTGLSQTVSGLESGVKYTFRIRCYKTNKVRGTYYSHYSSYASVKL